MRPLIRGVCLLYLNRCFSSGYAIDTVGRFATAPLPGVGSRSGSGQRAASQQAQGDVQVNPFKLIGWAAIAVAIVGAFTEIPYMALILLLLGLGVGVSIATEDSVRVMATALVLTGLSGVFGNIPEVGDYLTKIFEAGGTFVTGGAMTVISRNVWNRFKP